jgi:hypothetical protein
MNRRWLCGAGGSARVAVGLLTLLGCAAGASAQRDGRRIYEEQLRVRLDQQMPMAREIGLNAGGWFSYALFHYNDTDVERERTLNQFELRGWADFNVHGVHRGYVRGLLGWDVWNSGDNPLGEGNETNSEIERAWYQYDLGQVYRNEGQSPPLDMRIRVGRDYTEIGTALVLSMPLDMVLVELAGGGFELSGLLGATPSDTPNIDPSEPVFDHMERCFWGFELAYADLARHRPFVYVLSQDDHTGEHPRDPDQSYDYDSTYVGGGSEGTLLLSGLRYQAELVGQWGRTFSEGRTGMRTDIEAWALDVLLEYFVEHPTKPRLSAEYLFASGDDDRRLGSTSTVGGNLINTDDRAFNAFGFRDTGLAFAPRISNLQMYALGASFFPLAERGDLFEKMEWGTKVFLYHKAVDEGPISDFAATRPEGCLGWEWDVHCNWRITSDVTFTIRYGAFMPGAAFENDSCRHFLYSAVTFSF